MAKWNALDEEDRRETEEPKWLPEDKGVAQSCMYYLLYYSLCTEPDHVGLSWYAIRSEYFGMLSR